MLTFNLKKFKFKNDCAPSNEQKLTLKSQKNIEKVQVSVKKGSELFILLSTKKFLLQKS